MTNKLAFFFPGQGSQSVGMLSGFDDLPTVKKTLEEASDVLAVNFWAMATEPNELLNLTQHTQPLMLAAGVATWRAYIEKDGILPTIMAGHSLGEYTALVAAGSISFADALPLVKYRAEAMQNAVPEGQGAMAAILGLDDEIVRLICLEAAGNQVLEAVNFNSPGQVVIAGDQSAVDRGMELAKAKGAKRALPLPVSVPSHCALMKPAAQQLASYLSAVNVVAPNIQVLHNADVAAYDEPFLIKDALVRQLYSPVRWVETVRHLHQAGISLGVECGPGKVLAGLAKRIESEMQGVALTSTAAINELISQQSL